MLASCHRYDVTLVGHEGAPDGAPDDVLLAGALRKLGKSVRFAVWNNSGIDWALSPLTVVSSTWDYYHRPKLWLNWVSLAEKSTSLLNSPQALRWNMDKRYLGELVACGIHCVPTAFDECRDSAALAAVTREHQWDDVVVKPAVAASAAGARRFRGDSIEGEGEAHLAGLLTFGAALVQPYVSAVEVDLERSLVFIAGEFTHAFTKSSFNTDTSGNTTIEDHEPSAAELELAQAALAAAPGHLLYARVDMVPTPTGLLLMELELIEPDLGLRLCSAATDALARACAVHLRGETEVGRRVAPAGRAHGTRMRSGVTILRE